MLQNTGRLRNMALCKIPKLHLIPWCEDFVETYKTANRPKLCGNCTPEN